ncbi:PAS domain-containing hybrid sensor histidine kinase/response regulator [Gynuella sunshinyii]|uniref:histidine kinase n=1 Tax=Gynuella sunshinyii YC6258 TaxID=1445510 RepID=A0A0C5VU90_9GAMM|nr:hybrid sensor histidine kinase/response regulator [Gynuella sunshinyii]AJQ96878.1 Na+/proline symporter [Gynuella sunshinyii YC6258]
MEAWQILAIATGYIGIMFAVAIAGDRHLDKPLKIPPAAVYGLAMAVYCTSWTYYGAVGRAASSGWEYLPIYLAPILMFLFGNRIIYKALLVSKHQNCSSIADFLASRFGKRPGIAILVSVISLMAIIPYISLQLKAVTASINVISQSADTSQSAWLEDTTLPIAFSMTIFAILFGTRQVDVTEHHRGMMMAIAFESIVKLLALLTIGLFVVFTLFNGPQDFWQQFNSNSIMNAPFENRLNANFWTQMLLAGGAILVLPRQFHITVVENTNIEHFNLARWIFPLYLALISVVVIPITAAGLVLFEGQGLDADTFVLHIPMASQNIWLTILVFIGGFSAATAMIVVATLTMSTMLSNDVLLPLLLKTKRFKSRDGKDLSNALILIRRIAIVMIITLAYFYHHTYGSNDALSTIGLLAFSLVVQLVPAFLCGLYWKGANVWGAYAGLISGLALWFFTLMLPTLIHGGLWEPQILETGIMGKDWLRPEHLLWFGIDDHLSHGVFWSLLINTLALVSVSKLTSTRLIDRLQAAAFVEVLDPGKEVSESGFRRQNTTVSDLRALLERFAGVRRADFLLSEFARAHQLNLVESATPKLILIRYVERVLSSIIGSASARAMVHSILSGKSLGIEEVVTFFDETTQAIQFNQKLLSTTLENIDQGVSVIDRDLKLVAWNRRYIQMFDYPEGFIRVGRPIEDLVRYNASMGECGPGKIEDHVNRRLEHLRRGTPHRFIRLRRDGTVVEMKGNPFPGGGFVTTFNDISDHVRSQEALQRAKEELEARVEDRTRTIQDINLELRAEIAHREEVEQELIHARAIAEAANASKTRFLALASHDILQPLNAARLYTASLLDTQPIEGEQEQHTILQKLSDSLQSTEELISILLEIARLDDGALTPKQEAFPLMDILLPLEHEFDIIARKKGLAIKWVNTRHHVFSDPVYLRRIIQNLVSNAIKYTSQGKVLVGCRHHQGTLELQVWDTGPGISKQDQSKIFNDFYRIETTNHEQGVGLGLGVVHRMSNMLQHNLNIWSQPGKGTMFSVTIPIVDKKAIVTPFEIREVSSSLNNDFAGLKVLCVDNQPENLHALETLLTRWGCATTTVSQREEALNEAMPDLLLMDYQLDHGQDGITLTLDLWQQWKQQIPTILITANAEHSIRQLAREHGIGYLRKPIKPAQLRSLVTSFLRQAG